MAAFGEKMQFDLGVGLCRLVNAVAQAAKAIAGQVCCVRRPFAFWGGFWQRPGQWPPLTIAKS